MNYDDLIDALNENTRELKNLQKILPYHIKEISETETLLRVKKERAIFKEATDLIYDTAEDEW